MITASLLTLLLKRRRGAAAAAAAAAVFAYKFGELEEEERKSTFRCCSAKFPALMMKKKHSWLFWSPIVRGGRGK